MIKKLHLALSFLLITFYVKAQTLPLSGGGGAAYALTIPGTIALKPGITIKFQANAACAASPTINVNGTGALGIYKTSGSTLAAGDITNNQVVELVYDGGVWQMISASGSSSGVTGSGTTDYLSKWSSSTGLVSSGVIENGGNIGIGMASPIAKLHVISNSATNNGAQIELNSAASNASGLYVQTDLNGAAISANNSGTGLGLNIYSGNNSTGRGQFIYMGNAANTGYGLYVRHDGLGEAGNFQIVNAGSSSSALSVSTNGSGAALYATSGTGVAIESNGLIRTTDFRLTTSPSAGYYLQSDASGNASWQPVSGTLSGGTNNYIPKWTSASALSSTSLLFDDGTNLGVGTNGPLAKLDVAGQMYSRSYNAGAASTIDWSNGNNQTTSTGTAAITFTNMMDGGDYNLYTTSGVSTTYTFSQAGLSFYFAQSNAATVPGSITQYHFTRIGSSVYVDWKAIGTYYFTSNVGIGTNTPAQSLDVYNKFQVNPSGNIVRLNNVPTSFPAANSSGALTNDGAGNLSWTPPSAPPVQTASNGLTLSGTDVQLGGTLTANTTITQNGFTLTNAYTGTTTTGQTYNANSVTTASAKLITVNGITTGNALSLTSTSTLGNNSKMLNITRTGANTGATRTNYGVYSTVANTGATSINVAGFFKSTAAITNYSIQAEDGHVLLSNTGTANELRFAEPSGSGVNYTAFKAQAQTADVTYTLPPDDGNANDVLTSNGTGILTWTAPSATPAGANGQVQFNNSGAFGANSEMLWDNTNKRLNIGPATTGFTGMQLNVAGSLASNPAGITISGFGSPFNPVLMFNYGGGTPGSPSNAGAASSLGSIQFNGYEGGFVNTGASISVMTTQSWASSAHGAGLSFATTTNNTAAVTERMVIDHNGNVGIGTSAPDDILRIVSPAPSVRIEASGGTANQSDIGLFQNQAGTRTYGAGLSVRATSSDFWITTRTNLTDNARFVILNSSGNVGIGGTAPTSLFSVGASSQFQVNASGNIVKLNNVTTSFPAANSAGVMTNDGAGNLSWTASSSIAPIQTASNGLTLSANDVKLGGALTSPTTISSTSNANVASITNSGLTSGTALTVSSNSITGTAAGSSYVMQISRTGIHSNTGHTAYGIASTVSSTNATSGTNVAGYFSVSGATTANYGLDISATGGASVGAVTAISALANGNSSSSTRGIDVAATGGTTTSFAVRATQTSTTANTAYGIYSSVTGATAGTNIGGYFGASGGASNYAILVPANAGIVGIGTSSPNVNNKLNVVSSLAGSNASQVGIYTYASLASNQSGLFLCRAKGIESTPAIVASGDNIGQVSFGAHDGTNFYTAATISSYVDGTPGTTDMPGALAFATTPDGSATSTTRMTILNSGFVGIGTTAPAGKLQINAVTDGLIVRDGTNNDGIIIDKDQIRSGWIGTNLTVSGSNNLYFNTYAGSWLTRMTVQNNGNVGIGTTGPGYPLDIAATPTSVGATTMGAGARFFNTSNTTALTAAQPGGAVSVSVRATGAFWSNATTLAGGFYTSSDKRIKRIVGISNSANDLATLMKIRVTDYKFKDSLNAGELQVKGVIAQEVESVYPQAVSKQTSFIPNIYQLAENASVNEKEKTLSLTINNAGDLKAGDKVRLITPESDNLSKEIIAVNGNTFIVSNWTGKVEKIFVYGKEVYDFRIVDYDRLYTLSISAIQELVQREITTKAELDDLKKQFENQLNQNQRNEQRLMQYEKENASLKSDIEKIKSQLGIDLEVKK